MWRTGTIGKTIDVKFRINNTRRTRIFFRLSGSLSFENWPFLSSKIRTLVQSLADQLVHGALRCLPAAWWKNQNIVFLNVIETRLHSWWGAFDLSFKYNFTQTRIHIIFILSLQNSLKYNSYQQYNTKKCVSN